MGFDEVIEDLVVSEYPTRAAYQNRFEQLRGASHTRALPTSEFLTLFTSCGLEVEQVYTDHLTPALEQWLANAHTPDDRAGKVRAMIEQDELHDLSGTHPFRQHGAVYFRQRTAAFVSRKLNASHV